MYSPSYQNRARTVSAPILTVLDQAVRRPKQDENLRQIAIAASKLGGGNLPRLSEAREYTGAGYLRLLHSSSTAQPTVDFENLSTIPASCAWYDLVHCIPPGDGVDLSEDILLG